MLIVAVAFLVMVGLLGTAMFRATTPKPSRALTEATRLLLEINLHDDQLPSLPEELKARTNRFLQRHKEIG